ncbi:MAG: type I-A CRISPR-associated protein Cas4/Csa1, partial [Thermoproteus sp.]|nr:type I-A CRISPR-associated protein Cas4/Csa1 [Thermoproteus sp.]
SVSDVVNRYCPTGRDLYLKKVLGIKAEPNAAMVRGRYLHAVFKRALAEAAAIIERGVSEGWELLSRFNAEAVVKAAAEEAGAKPEEAGVKLARAVAVRAAAELDDVVSRLGQTDPRTLAARAVPLVAEYAVDGAPLGLTPLRVDALYRDVVVEIKTGRHLEKHKLALAAYAMALEAELEMPVDYGLLVYMWIDKGISIRATPVPLKAELRKRFLEVRNKLMELIASGRDPGVARSCNKSCPFYSHCHGAGR